MKNLIVLLMSYVFLIANATATEVENEIPEIDVPKGWTATDSGLAKGDSELSIGPVLDLGGLSPLEYINELAKIPIDGTQIKSIGETKDGPIVAQVTRELTQDGDTVRSIFFICKKGVNKHRLLELFTGDVFAVISGGKAAIGFCDK